MMERPLLTKILLLTIFTAKLPAALTIPKVIDHPARSFWVLLLPCWCFILSAGSVIHHLVMLPNVMQVAVLLSSLAQKEYSDIAVSIGADIWLQLSHYCKERIEEQFFHSDPALKNFIDRIEYSIKRGPIVGFVKETEMEVAAIPEQLILAIKAGRSCNITLDKDGKTIELQDHKIEILKNHYAAVSAEGPSERVDFIEENVSFIELI